MTPEAPPSKSAVRRAGSTVRAHLNSDAPWDAEKMQQAIDVIDSYRAQFSVPTSKVATGLRSMCNTLRLDAEVSQRMKRHVTIVEKLAREKGLDLSRMQDIGGCRVVLQDVTELRTIERRIEQVWGDSIMRKADYILSPRESGYRALHIVVKRDGFPVEIQLRDPVMHSWAENVEALSAFTRVNYKQDGDSLVQNFMRLESEFAQLHEQGVEVSAAQLDYLDTLRAKVWQYMTELPPLEGDQP